VKKIGIITTFIFLITLFIANGFAQSEELQTEKIEDLERTLDLIQRRMREVEEEINELKGMTDEKSRTEQMEERFMMLEKEIEKQKRPNTFHAYWKDGLRFKTYDDKFKFGIVGLIINDWDFLSGDDDIEDRFGDLEDGTRFRSARLGVKGLMYDRVEFMAVYDFKQGDTDFMDVYLGLLELPVVGNIRVGHFREPFGLELLTSINHISFMERGLTDTFDPIRNTGLMLHNHILNDRMTWAAGIFRETDDFGDGSSDGDYNVTARLTGLPWYKNQGEKLLHLGMAFSHKSPVDETIRWKYRPCCALAPLFVDTGNFPADHAYLFGTEAAIVYGPLSIQGELDNVINDVRLRKFRRERGIPQIETDDDDPHFNAYYVYVSYILTGEHRNYKLKNGAFGGVRPKRNFLSRDGVFGLGAWEILFRHGSVDLDDELISGGELNGYTFGLNWYLNPNTRIMFNYVRADLDDDNTEFGKKKGGNADIAQFRFNIFW